MLGKHRKIGKADRTQSRHESPASEAVTVAWTVALTTIFCCDLAILVLSYLLRQAPAADGVRMLRELLLFAGALVGALALVLTPVIYRVRRTPPPRLMAWVGCCLAAAPLVVLFVRSTR